MPTYLKGVTAGEAFTSRYMSCHLSATNTVSMNDAGGDLVNAIGICTNKPGSGEAADVVVHGECLALVTDDGGEISAGDRLYADNSNSGLQKSDGSDDHRVIAIALEGGGAVADGDLLRVLVIGPDVQG